MDNIKSDKNIKGDVSPWLKEGLRFECQRCGRCCRGAPGVVWVNRREVEGIALLLGITQEVFARNYLRSINGRFSLLEYGNGDCIMYDNGCKIYNVRPCHAGRSVLDIESESQSEWEKLNKTCPGIGKGNYIH